MKKFCLIVFFALLVSAASAADDYRVVSIQVLKAAQYPVSFVGRTPAIYSMQYVTDTDGTNYTFRNDTLLAHEAALGIKNTLEEWQTLADYDIPVYDFYAFCNNQGACNDSVNAIKDYNLLILVREIAVVAPFLRAAKYNYNDYYDSDYYFKIGIYAPYTATFEIYDADTQRFLHKETMSDTLLWQEDVSDFQYRNSENYGAKNLPSLSEAASLAAAEVGKKYAAKLAPQWISVQRFFFVPSGRELKQAADYAEASQWDEAMKIWAQQAGSANRKVAGQSAFNMALGCEVTGRYELALEWLMYAEKLYTIGEIAGYRAILQRRINESKTLEKQLQDL